MKGGRVYGVVVESGAYVAGEGGGIEVEWALSGCHRCKQGCQHQRSVEEEGNGKRS